MRLWKGHIDNCPKNNLKFIIGDMKAREETNKNGNRLINLAASQNMVIGSTRFESSDGETQN